MAKSAQSVVAAAAATLLLVAGLVLVARAGDTPDAAVLARQLVRETTTTTEIVPEITTTTAAGDLGSVVIETTTTTAASGAPASSTTVVRRATTTTTAPQPDPQRTVERADTTSAFDYRADGTGTMTTAGSAGPKDPFAFKALGADVDHDGVAELRSEMANQTGREIVFPEGLVLRFLMTRDGQQWRTVELRFPDTRSLPAGGSLEVETATPLQQQYGHFEVSGETTVEYR